jgi:RHS repeat-associated protein
MTTHVWDGSNISLDIVDGTATKYIRGIGLISSDDTFYLYNAHGDVVQLTDNLGGVVKEYDYDAFGVERNPDSNDTNPWRYCGEYFDVETGTVYLRARYYAPKVGRFSQEDPWWNVGNMIYGSEPVKWNERESDPNDPSGLNLYTYKPDIHAIMQSSNLYVYCGNNPLRWIDPSGEFYICPYTIKQAGQQLWWGAKKYSPMAWNQVKQWGGQFGNWVGGLFGSSGPKIANITQQTQSHIMQSHHQWDKVVKNPNNWSQINKVVKDVIGKGTHTPQATEGVFHATKKVGNETVTVTYRIVNGEIRVSNAWVNR